MPLMPDRFRGQPRGALTRVALGATRELRAFHDTGRGTLSLCVYDAGVSSGALRLARRDLPAFRRGVGAIERALRTRAEAK